MGYIIKIGHNYYKNILGVTRTPSTLHKEWFLLTEHFKISSSSVK